MQFRESAFCGGQFILTFVTVSSSDVSKLGETRPLQRQGTGGDGVIIAATDVKASCRPWRMSDKMDIDGLSADMDSAIRGTFIGVPESSRKQTVRLCLGATSILAVVSLLLHEALTASPDAPPTGLVKNLTIIAFLITASITLFIRSRFPMAVLIIECAEVIGSLTLGFGTQTSAQALLITAIYACIRLPFAMQVTTDGIFTLFLFWQHFYAQSLHLAYSILFPLLAFVGIVSTSYDCVAEQRRTRSAINETQKRADGWEEQYLRAEKRSHIANELHDSIGHHLASIAALSQGAETLISKDKGAENDIRDALQEITAIAKGCLEETRAALRCLNMEDDSETIAHRSDAQGSVPPWQRLRDWGDILPLLKHVRNSGVHVSFVESGSRNHDLRRSDLCFAVTREALTNALRHGRRMSAIAISWDHGADASTTVTVTDNGRTGNTEWTYGPIGGHRTGSGLRALEQRVLRAGGIFLCGATLSGWTVKAIIP